MSDEQFDKLWHHMNDRFDELRADIQAVDGKVGRIYNHLDEVRGLLDTDELERAALADQVSRHDDTIEKHALRLDAMEQRAA